MFFPTVNIMMRIGRVKIYSYGILMAAFMMPGLTLSAQKETSSCKDSNVVVAYDNIEDYELVCKALIDVIGVAKKIGLSEELPVQITFVDKLTIGHTGAHIALFNSATMQVQMLSREACIRSFKDEVIFGLELDKELYKSMIIHELAHVLAWQNRGLKPIRREMHEYFAYAIQLALLDESHRTRVILSNDVPAFSDRSEITELYYLLNPHFFAVKSYLHFKNIENGWAYLWSILKE